MRLSTLLVPSALALLATAPSCGGNVDAFADQGDASAAGSGGSTIEAGVPDGSGGSAGNGGAAGGGGSAGSGGSAGQAGSGGAGGVGGGGGGLPIDSGVVPPACVDCINTTCPQQAAACATDTVCQCYLACVNSGQLSQQCFFGCGQPSQSAIGLLQCAGGCRTQCGGGGGTGGSGGSAGAGGAGGGTGGSGGTAGAGGAGGSGGTTVTDAGAVPPLEGGISAACDQCAATSCPQQVAACEASTSCTCWAGCFTGNNWTTCGQQCGGFPPNSFNGLAGCVQQACATSCQ